MATVAFGKRNWARLISAAPVAESAKQITSVTPILTLCVFSSVVSSLSSIICSPFCWNGSSANTQTEKSMRRTHRVHVVLFSIHCHVTRKRRLSNQPIESLFRSRMDLWEVIYFILIYCQVTFTSCSEKKYHAFLENLFIKDE